MVERKSICKLLLLLRGLYSIYGTFKCSTNADNYDKYSQCRKLFNKCLIVLHHSHKEKYDSAAPSPLTLIVLRRRHKDKYVSAAPSPLTLIVLRHRHQGKYDSAAPSP